MDVDELKSEDGVTILRAPRKERIGRLEITAPYYTTEGELVFQGGLEREIRPYHVIVSVSRTTDAAQAASLLRRIAALLEEKPALLDLAKDAE